VARITVDVRRLAARARLVSRRRLGARDSGDVRVTLRKLSPGRYRARVRAVDATGRRSATATVEFCIRR
jgi:predicted phage tail protein